MDYLTIFLIAVVAYAILVASTYAVFKASMASVKEAAEKAEVCAVGSESAINDDLGVNESEPNHSLD